MEGDWRDEGEAAGGGVGAVGFGGSDQCGYGGIFLGGVVVAWGLGWVGDGDFADIAPPSFRVGALHEGGYGVVLWGGIGGDVVGGILEKAWGNLGSGFGGVGGVCLFGEVFGGDFNRSRVGVDWGGGASAEGSIIGGGFSGVGGGIFAD